MSERGTKVHLACDGLNRTGQEAPASHTLKVKRLIMEADKMSDGQLLELIYLAHSLSSQKDE